MHLQNKAKQSTEEVLLRAWGCPNCLLRLLPTQLLILVISGWPRVWIRIQSKHATCVGEGGGDYTGLFRLSPFHTSRQKLKYIQHNFCCPVLVCGELKPHWQAIMWYQISKHTSDASHQLVGGNCLFVGNVKTATSCEMPMPAGR